jgi:hypothetical protein
LVTRGAITLNGLEARQQRTGLSRPGQLSIVTTMECYNTPTLRLAKSSSTSPPLLTLHTHDSLLTPVLPHHGPLPVRLPARRHLARLAPHLVDQVVPYTWACGAARCCCTTPLSPTTPPHALEGQCMPWPLPKAVSHWTGGRANGLVSWAMWLELFSGLQLGAGVRVERWSNGV